MFTIAIAAISLVSAQGFDGALESAIASINQEAISYYNAHSTDAGVESVVVSYGGDIANLLSTRSEYGEYYSVLTQKLGALTDASAVGAFITQEQEQSAEATTPGGSSESVTASASTSGYSSGSASAKSASSSSSDSKSGSSTSDSKAANGAFQAGLSLSVAAGFVGALLL